MKLLTLFGLLALLGSPGHGADTGTTARITGGMISNQIARIDALARAADFDAYAALLAEDLVVRARTPALDEADGSEEEELTREEYLDQVRETFRDVRVLAHVSNVQAIDIHPDGQQANCELVVFQRYADVDTNERVSMAVKVKSTIALRGGALLITRLEMTVTDLAME